MTDLEKALKLRADLLDFVNLIGGENAISNEEYANIRNYFVNKYSTVTPRLLIESRSLGDLIAALKRYSSGSGSWQMRRDYINDHFSDFLDYLEFGTDIHNSQESNFTGSQIIIDLQEDVFNHVKDLLNDGHYFNAVEESYKIVRSKLQKITGEEQAHKAFAETNYIKIFGKEPESQIEKDFFEGVKYLHMAIQKLRNEKAHSPAMKLDKNLAIHYIVLAGLSYDLINRK